MAGTSATVVLSLGPRRLKNFRYSGYSNPNDREIHSADGKNYIVGIHGAWDVYFHGVHIASFWRRKFAREFIRQLKADKARSELAQQFNCS